MAEHNTPIDIGDAPELLQLAEEVHRSHESRVLRHEGEDLAMIASVSRRRSGKAVCNIWTKSLKPLGPRIPAGGPSNTLHHIPLVV